VSRFVVNPASLPVSFEIDTTARLTISPDGARVAFVAKDASDNTLKVFLREMSSLDTTPVAGSVDPYDPFFSTDGQWIFFASKDYLWKVPVSGGPRTEVTKLTGFHKGSAWCADGVLCAPSASTGLYRVSTSGGGLEALTRLDASKNEVSHRWPEILPGGRQVLCTIKKSGIATFDEAEIAVYSLDTKTWKTIHRGGYYARYARSGHLLYIRDGALMAAPFDLTRLDVVGPAARVVAGVMCEPGSGAAQYALSSTGTLVYVPGGPYERPWEFFWLHKDGTETPVGSPLRPVVHFRLSRDGTRIAQVISGATDSAFVFDIGRGMLTRATFDGNVNNLSWTHDGKSLVYVSDLDGGGIFQSPVDGSGTPVKLLGSPDSISRVEICGGSKPALIYVKGNMGARDIWQVSLDTGAAETPLVKTPFDESDGLVSPDGRWLAYESNETGRREIYVSPYPPGGGRWQVSKDGGFAPIWSPDSSRLYFRLENGNPQVDLEAVQKLMVVSLAAAGGFSASAPQVAFEWTGTDVVDLSPDGEKLLAARRQKPTFQSTEIIAVVNWFDELKAKVPLR
jgi:serine/threonine-protein kinase